MTHEQAELDELWFAKVGADGLPRVVVDVALREQCIDCAQERTLARAPPVRGRTNPDAFDRGGVKAQATSEPRVVLQLVSAVTEVGYAENDKFGLTPPEAPAGHQSSRKKEPGAEEPALSPQRAEEVCVGYARAPRYQPAENPVGQTELAQATRLDARRRMSDEMWSGGHVVRLARTIRRTTRVVRGAGGLHGNALPSCHGVRQQSTARRL
jgi:hypothetical protein